MCFAAIDDVNVTTVTSILLAKPSILIICGAGSLDSEADSEANAWLQIRPV